MRFYFYWCILLSLSLQACYFIHHDVTIDNTSSKKLAIEIDQEKFILSPKSFLEVKISNGNHQVVVRDDSSHQVLKKWPKLGIYKDGLLNICANEYIIQNNRFVNFESVNIKEIPDHTLVLNGYTYQGNLSKTSADKVFIEKCWDRGLDEDITNIEEVNPAHKTLVKIYRIEDFEKDFLRNVR